MGNFFHKLSELVHIKKYFLYALDYRFDKNNENIENQSLQIQALTNNVVRLQSEIVSACNRVEVVAQQTLDISMAMYDNIPYFVRKLDLIRTESAYVNIYKDKNPLISVRIATYNRSKLLIDRAISSVFAQTYQNFEIVIVGDHCTDDTEERIAALNDPRISFYNFDNPTRYPKDKFNRWHVGGAVAMNSAAQRAKGVWIAPLDDDDEFAPDHLQALLSVALGKKAEFVFSSINQVNELSGEQVKIWSDPPEFGHFGFQGALYLNSLNFFEYDQKSWAMREVADWNMCRRMLEAGVRYAGVDKILTTIYYIPIHHENHI